MSVLVNFLSFLIYVREVSICFMLTVNNVYPDQTPQDVVSDQGVHYFPMSYLLG